ncbi:MAG: iron-sulfur cluster assembly scaffold protein [Deltaproteobacteria bacterium RBG_19FT_COMBO_46_12]|nr:MAG: iron-sulfur cluster assembly scaffold protein [Deltaproteobacteria bacterium RBG_19FT_COMBO_46_12]
MAKYPKFLMEHFQNPKNVGEVSNPDGVGTVGNASCGDIMQMFIKVDGGKITEAKFKTFGCGAAIATSSILTERIIGATPDDAMKISEETSKEILAQLPKEKVPCFTLATDALKLAIEEFQCKRIGVHEKGGFDLKEMERD